MARRPRAFNRIAAAIGAWEPEIRRAFLDAIEDLRSGADVQAIAERIERGDVDGALRAVGIDAAAFRGFERAIEEAFNAGGTAAIGGLPALMEPDGARLAIRFDGRFLRAERIIRDHSSRLVTRIVDDQRDAIRAALREGLEIGLNPRTTALDIVGRINRATGRREGGIVGLSGPQERHVASARRELLSGDPTQLANYLTRERRDRRFDAIVRRAIADEKPVAAADVSRITARYSDRLLELRGETIARTETIASVNAGQDEAMRQVIDTGRVRVDQITKTWIAASDPRTRDTHAAMNGQRVAFGAAFTSPSGAQLMYPGDQSLGAPASEIIQCRCTIRHAVSWLDGLT